MAKMKMKSIRIFALRSDRKLLLERLQLLGAVQVESAKAPPDGFDRDDKDAEAQIFERYAATASQALGILDRIAPDKKGMLSSLSGRRIVSESEFAGSVGAADEIMRLCSRIIELDRQTVENAAETARVRANIAQLIPWERLDVPFCFNGTKTTAAFIGSFPAQYTEHTLAEAIAQAAPEINFDLELLNSSFAQSCACIICGAADRGRMDSALRGLGFAKPMGANRSIPADKINRLNDRLDEIRRQTAAANDEIAGLSERRHDIETMVDYYTMRAEKYRVISGLDSSKHTFMITGYIPADDEAAVRADLESLCPVVIETADADPETAPVKLKNNAFTAPAESIVSMYAMPSAQDIDPTPLMSFFFYLFFGMMFSDAGYGLIMIIATTVAIRKLHPERAMYENMKLFQYCGVSTFLWGLVFGGFFGDAPSVIASTFFNSDWEMPALLNPINDAVTLLILSVALGLVQVLVGMGAKFYILWRGGDRVGAVCDVGFWMTMLVGFALMAGGLAGVPVLISVGAATAIASALGIALTGGRSKKGAMKILGGVAGLYDVTGYVSDLISYSRLMALGLTTGVMAQVFNILSTMMGKNLIGILCMILIFVLGHAINFGLNVLGAYVHTMRLQYVEMFSKFYEGGGRPFTPFAFNSKYIRLQEETKV